MSSGFLKTESLLLILFLFLLGIHGACTGSSKIRKTANKDIILKKDSLKSQELLTLLMENQADPEWISAKSSIKAEHNGKVQSFTINLRYRQDSLIWMSFSPLLGIEVARALITTDSIKFMDKHNKRYLITDFQYVSERLDFEITFAQLEALLLGNLFEYVKNNKYKSIYMDNEVYVMSTLSKRSIIKTLKDKELHKNIVQDVWINPSNNRIVATNVFDDKSGRTINLKHEDHLLTESGTIPQKSFFELIISDANALKLYVSHIKFEINEEKSIPFKIPSGYKAMR